MNKCFSLLYPDNPDKYEFKFSNNDFLKDLNINELFRFQNNTYSNGFYYFSDNLFKYFTNNIDVIKYRQEIMDDILSKPEIFELIKNTLVNIEVIKTILSENIITSKDLIDEISSISLIELYIQIVDDFHKTFKSNKPNSKGLTELFQYVENIYNSHEFTSLKNNIPKMSEKFTSIKSVTIGVNLYGDLSPIEVGLVSINNKKFKSGSIIDRLLKLDIEKDEFTCLAPLTRTPREFNNNEIASFNNSISTAIKKILAKNIKAWSPAINNFFRLNTQFFVNLYEEILFYMAEKTLIDDLNCLGINVCKPKIAPQNSTYKIKNVICPLFINSKTRDFVANDIIFDENSGFYILTGPNRGGKSIYLKTIGICQALFQMGMYVPAEYAEMYPMDNIFTHFSDKNITINTSRFEEECIHLKSIFEHITNDSMVLFDEMFSSTNSYEAEYLAKDILTALCYKGAKGLLVTHIHNLSTLVDEVNLSTKSITKLGNLSVDINADGSHKFSIVRKRSDGKSYARDIAQKYDLTLEKLI